MPKREKSFQEIELGFKFEETIRNILRFLDREDDQFFDEITKARQESKNNKYDLEKVRTYQKLLFTLLWEYLLSKYSQDEDQLRQELTDLSTKAGSILTAYRNQYNIEGIVTNDFRPFCEAVAIGNTELYLPIQEG